MTSINFDFRDQIFHPIGGADHYAKPSDAKVLATIRSLGYYVYPAKDGTYRLRAEEHQLVCLSAADALRKATNIFAEAIT